MKTLYLDCSMGAAGDMLTAALLELHPNPDAILARLGDLHLPGVTVAAEPAENGGVRGTHMAVTVHGEEEGGHHHDDHHHDHHHEHEHGHDHEHHHDHDHGDSCSCGHHHSQEELDQIHAQLGCEGACDACDLCDSCIHSTHHHHDADEVFVSWGRETARKYSREELQEILAALAMGEDYGYILRAKGMVPCDDGSTWLHFDLVPEEFQVREGAADYTGRLCVIGSDLKEDQLDKLFLLA